MGVTTAVVVLLAIVGAGLLFDRQQAADIRRQVEASVATADDVVDAPAGIWLVEVRPAGLQSTAGTPPALAAAAAASLRPAARTTDSSNAAGPGASFPLTVVADGREWPAAGIRREDRLYAAVYDVRLHATQERSLLVALGLAGLVGVALSALTGLLAGRRAVRPLPEALELQRQFIADVSHELRTPLAVISTRAQMLRRSIRGGLARPGGDAEGAAGGNDVAREADQLVDDTKAMGEVLSDLLLSAQLDAGEAPREIVDVAAVARGVVVSLRPYAAESGVAVVWLGACETPATGGDADAIGDRAEAFVEGVSTSLRRAVLALVDNAVAHSEAGDTVEVAARHTDRAVRLEVIDHGPGVAVEEVEALTHRFARARRDSGDRRFGLGLALVTQIVRHHGGSLEFTPTEGGGATFSLVLPAPAGR
ncbi:MAG: sensor histidine kinase [Terrabacter sp.]